jgi:hypothetical protein
MHFVRVYATATLSRWDDPTRSNIDLGKEVFRSKPDDPRPSFYRVESNADEVRTAAAHSLTFYDQKPKILFAIRVFPEDIEALHLRMSDDAPGATGVVEVDFRHRELLYPSDEDLGALVQRIRDGAAGTQDRFRWIGVTFQSPHFRAFLNEESPRVIDEAKRRCRVKLGQTNAVGKSPARIQEDLTRFPPAIPTASIERAAFLNYRHRIEHEIAGSAEDDWEKAVRDLREIYLHSLCG